MRISIIGGAGHVGLVTGACFAEKGHEVLCIDVDQSKIEKLKNREIPFYEPGLEDICVRNVVQQRLSFSTQTEDCLRHGEVTFICVGTPAGVEGRSDLYYVESVARQIAERLSKYHLIVEKSTVPVTTGEKVRITVERYAAEGVPFDIASNPEFTAEGRAVEDMLHPDRIVVGVHSEQAERLMREIYEPFDAPLIVTSINSAELVKHASNAFLALKISFVNALSRICELSGADIVEVAYALGLDQRIGGAFLRAGIGYGGSCFPKDLDAMVHIAHSLGYEFNLLKEVQDINRDQLDHFVERIEQELWILKDKTVGIWGLAFKPETDDIRESPGIKLIRALQERGTRIQVYDPAAMDHARRILKDVVFCNDAYEACFNADALVVCTEWKEFQEADLRQVKSALRLPILFDGRNVFEPKSAKELDFIYHGVGRL